MARHCAEILTEGVLTTSISGEQLRTEERWVSPEMGLWALGTAFPDTQKNS